MSKQYFPQNVKELIISSKINKNDFEPAKNNVV